MWILPRQLHTSPFVPDTEALISDSNEQSEICAQSLLARSKPSPARTWSQRWKRDSWTQHLSGRILKPSHGQTFVTAWTSCLAATRASRSQPPASGSEPKTQDTSGRLSQPELLQCDQQSAFLRMSKDIFLSGCATCCKTWQDWVTERRGAWRQRVNAARLTRGGGSSSWPTATSQDGKQGGITPFQAKGGNHTNLLHVAAINEEQKNWPSPVASEVRQGFQDRSKGMKGSQESLTTVVIKHGQAAPASSSSLGSRQGLWPTPCANNPNEGETLESWDRRQALNKAKHNNGNGAGTPLAIKVKQELWLTPRANEPDSDPNFAARNADRGAHCHGTLSSQAKTQDFPTPRTCDWKSSPNADSNIKRMEVGQATLAEFVHAKHKKGDLWSTPRTGATESSRPNNKGGIPLADQAKREQWATPQAHDAQGPKTPEQIAVMRAKGHGVKNLNEQATWATPQAKDHKSGHRDPMIVQYKQLNVEVEAKATGKLNPRWVETLMGLPIGWTMPSCTSPVTIAPTSCDSSGTALCQPAQSERSDFLLAI